MKPGSTAILPWSNLITRLPRQTKTAIDFCTVAKFMWILVITLCILKPVLQACSFSPRSHLPFLQTMFLIYVADESSRKVSILFLKILEWSTEVSIKPWFSEKKNLLWRSAHANSSKCTLKLPCLYSKTETYSKYISS